MRPSTIRLPLVSLCCLALVACSRGPKPVPVVDARTQGTLMMWRSDVAPRFSAEAWREFDAAVQEIRMRAMAQGASGTDAISDETLKQMNGLTFTEVLRCGYLAKLERLDALRTGLQRMVDANAMIATKPGDTESEAELDHMRSDQLQRLQKVIDEVDITRQRVLALGGTLEEPKEPQLSASAAAVPRDTALKEINKLILYRRDSGMLKYGAWPVKIDLDGARLSPEQKSDFDSKRAAANQNGHAVAAVRVHDKWWIYDDHPTIPTFSPAVTANLTDADKRQIEDSWASVDAENWARKMAHEEVAAQDNAGLNATFNKVLQELSRPKIEPPKPVLE